ncbi:MAG: MarR family transcriptional regulator [Vicingus serpentipes]|nr:MarR family transcriptional regulator [Vicingus serpentipes]
MKLEEELKQDKFKSEYQKAILNILFTGNWLESDSSRILKPFGLSPQQYNVLRILKGQGDNAISVNDIMSRMIDKMSNASRLVEKLRQKELIERVICEHDRRQVDVRITKKGMGLLEKANKEMTSFTLLKSKISEKEAKLLNEILEKIRA